MNAKLIEGDSTVQKATNGRKRPETISEDVIIHPYFARKAFAVKIVGILLLIAAAPVIALLVLIVRLTSAGPGLYRQTRAGRDGKEFEMYKIRTMYTNAETVSGPVWCVPNDSRITPIGRLLRLLHLDELPQLINVARGEMDLIGPRPERPVFVAKLARAIPNYHSRLKVLPGVTGLAQINLPPDETIECVRRKLVLDCQYIREASLSMDTRILLCTLLRMLGIRHGRAVRWLRLERHVHLQDESNTRPAEAHSFQPEAEAALSLDAEYCLDSVNGAGVLTMAENGGTNGSSLLQPAAAISHQFPR